MGSSQKFCWTNEVKNDLITIVHSMDEPLNWTHITTKFKELHPKYQGKPDAVRIQYSRIKNTGAISSADNLAKPNLKTQTFRWTEKALDDLLRIVESEEEQSWSTVLNKFMKTHPEYIGSSRALLMQYSRIAKNKTGQKNTNNLTKSESLDLIRLANLICVDGYPNWTKIFYTFKNLHPSFEGNKSDLRQYHESISDKYNEIFQSSGDLENLVEWGDDLDKILAQAVGHAQHIISAQTRDGRRKSSENLGKLTVKLFKEFYKSRIGLEFLGTDAIILWHFYDYKENLMSRSFVCEDDMDTMSNIDHKQLLAYASKNHSLAFSNVFAECCHNCGVIFSRKRTNSNSKMLPHPLTSSPRVVEIRPCVPFVYCVEEKYITCLECFRNPNWPNDYSVMISSTNSHAVPLELSNLNEYEQNQIALCGGFYTVYQKQNSVCKIFEHRQGECNIGKKRDIDYHNVFTTYYSIERPIKLDASGEKIKAALRWLRKHNRLYKDFLSNYETIYGYLMSVYRIRPEERIIQISKGNLNDLVGKDTTGLLIPADNIKIESESKPETHKFGIQHPLEKKLTRLREIINVNYSDPDLEAKRWPHLFPEGNGSWKANSSLKQQTYVKHRLLGIDSRFRNNNEFMFFWYDRLIKQRLLYVNNRQRTVNVNELIDSIQVKNIRENTSRYGAVVPSTIPGSKTYFRAKRSDLLSMHRDLGKSDLFVTLTQNDNWLELQRVCGKITAMELQTLDQPIMQPALGGKSVVQSPVETVVAFFRRLEMFMKTCVHNKNGPFGEVLDYWFRIEYQNRGALHCHMVLWICKDTIPDDVVSAEMPRYCGQDNDIKHHTFQAREYVKAFQLHTCKLGSCKKDTNSKCKYGFPYGIQLSEEINQSKMGYTYKRHSDEDKNVVPYNLYALMCWNGHINVQKVTPNGIEAYLCKYVSKPEKSIDIKDISSDAERFIKARIVGILECVAHLLQFHQIGSSRKTIFLPCDFQPKQRMLKRRAHLPADNESEDVYYQTLLHKYLVRPKELHNFTYIDLFRFYDVEHAMSKHAAQNIDTEKWESQDESDVDIKPKMDESQFEFTGRVRNIKSQRMVYYSHGYKYAERGKAAVPRWRFLMPFGTESEKYYEQRLLLHVPITLEELNEDGYPFSEENASKTFIEECCLRGLVDSEETAKSALLGAVQRGFSVDRVLELAALFVDQSYVSKEFVDSIIIPWVESMPITEKDINEETDEYGEELSKMVEMRVKYEPYNSYLESMTPSQRNVMEWVDHKITKNEQILAIISGGAGVGKSFITRALYSYFVEKKMVCILLATTGSAAHLISGTTVHYYLKVDIHGNKYMQPGTISAKIVEDTDVIICDEFSMLNADLLDQMNDCAREYGNSKQMPLGGKHLFLIGDPCQLPAVGKSVFSNPLLNEFSILLLKETVRQKDETFAALLNRVRVNMITEEDKNLLRSRYTHVSNIECNDDTLIVTATRKKMKFYNLRFISSLPGEAVKVIAEDFEQETNNKVSFAVKEKIRTYLTNLWDEELIIKEGCIVRLLRNMDVTTGWVNSKRAKVFRVAADGSYIVLQDINDESKQLPLTKIRQPFKLGANLYYRYQYPLILGYATTVHAVQGTTVTGKYYVDLDRSFWESGQAFVALSRPKEMSQLFLLNTHFEKVILKPYYKNLLEWMTEVDEISIMRKPRRNGDFPLIPLDAQKCSQMQAFPLLNDTESPKPVKKFKNFKPPRKLRKNVSESVSDLVSEQDKLSLKSRAKSLANLNQAGPGISRRIYKLAEDFRNSCNNSTVAQNQIRFGVKFMNELLEELNDILKIHSVFDPILIAERGRQVSDDLIQKWAEQVERTLVCFRKYACQFRTEFQIFVELIMALEVCKYSSQQLAMNVTEYICNGKKFQPINIVGDGRCFYHSVSMNLAGNCTLTNSLKLVIAFTIIDDFEIFDSIFATLASSASNVLLKVLSYNCWADMEIITAASYAVKRPIVVISGLDGSGRVERTRYDPLDIELDPLYLGFVKINDECETPNHFVALLLDASFVLPTNNLHTDFEKSLSLENVPTIDLPEDDVDMMDASELEESL